MDYAHSILSLLPILLTLILSLWTRNVIIGLFVGVCCGIFMLQTSFAPLDTFRLIVQDYFVPQLTDSYNAGVLVLLIFISGFVALMEKSGGGQAFATKVTNVLNQRGHTQLAAWLGGIMIFFSDLGTPLIVGPAFRPLFDKLKISRQKLAFILDSTASPVAILVPFIGWGVYIMSLLQKEISELAPNLNDWDLFIAAIPYQFYAFLALGILPILAIKKLDFGAMAKAEYNAQQGTSDLSNTETLNAFTHKNARPSFVWLPLLVMASVFAALLVPQGFPFEKVPGSVFRAALSSAYFFAAVTLLILMAVYGVRDLKNGIDLYLKGMSNMMSVAIILILAWTLSSVGKSLGTPEYITSLAQANFASWVLPCVIFLFSAIISFATGSSWGTFAIMFPLAIPSAFAIDAHLYACIGAVLSGGLFGDHSSPISETTILSSTGAGCDQFEHFRTQLPYALINGSLAFIFFLIAGFVQSSLLFVAALICQFFLVYLIAKKWQNKHKISFN